MRSVIHYDRVDGRDESLLLVREPKDAFTRGDEIVDQDGVRWLVAAVERVRHMAEGECGLFVQRAIERPPSSTPPARRPVAYVWR